MVVEEGVCPKVFIGSGAIIERECLFDNGFYKKEWYILEQVYWRGLFNLLLKITWFYFPV